MPDDRIHEHEEGRKFDFVGDTVTIKVGAAETGGAYSTMHWVVAPRADAVMHVHEDYEETFYVLNGTVEFFLGDESRRVETGAFIRVPPGVSHGYVNHSDERARMLVGFTPGGMEELFYKFRTGAGTFDTQGFLEEAKREHRTEYEVDV